MKEFDAKSKGASIMLGGLLMCLVSFGVMIYQTDIIRYNVTVNAVVSDISQYTSDDYTVSVDYSYGGQEYSRNLTTGNSYGGIQKGDTIIIYVDPYDPGRIAVKQDNFMAYVFFFSGVCIGIAGIIYYFKGKE